VSEDIREGPPPPGNVALPRQHFDYPDGSCEEGPRFPATVTAAGALLIVAGVPILLYAFLVFLYLAVTSTWPLESGNGAGGQLDERAGCGACALAFFFLLGAFILWAGVRAVRGRLAGTLTSGIASIALGMLTFESAAQGARGGAVIWVGIEVPIGAVLVAAGVLALLGRKQYKLWRMAHSAGRERVARTNSSIRK
jgi:hypothetical protein